MKSTARTLKEEVVALYFACKDPRTPWYARVLAAIVAGYAFSPIDLVPDFIPVLGYLDDLLLIPLGVYVALKLIPRAVLDDARSKARSAEAYQIRSILGAVITVAIWLTFIVLIGLCVRASARWFR